MRRALAASLLIGACLVACARPKADPVPAPVEPAPKAATAPLPPRLDDEDPALTVNKLEERVQRGDLSGFYTPVGIDLVTVARDGKTETERFPEALHKHGESVLGAWAAPDGSFFAAGFMYTGVPGPDTGAIYQKDKKGPLRIAFTKSAKELSSVWGRKTNDVYAAGKDVLVHWDGSAWKELPVEGVEGDIAGVWGSESQLFLIANAAHDGRVYARKNEGGAWKEETVTRSCFLRALHGAGSSVWAGGDCGLVLSRGKDGAWKEERRQPGGIVMHLWATSEHDAHAAAIDLLHTTGDGTWSSVPVPSTRIFGLTGSGRDVYALGVNGVFRGSAAGFTKLPFDSTACQVLAANAGTLHCLRERRQAVTRMPP